MKAMVLEQPGESLRETERPVPEPGPGQVLLRVRACGVCRTDLHVVDGELPYPSCPLVPGHQVVGVVEATAAASRVPGRPAGRRAVARLDLRRLPLLRERPREPLRRGALHRLPRGRRLRRACRRRRALLLLDPRGLHRRAGRAAPLRRADRLPLARDGRRRASASASTASAPPRTSSPRSRGTRAARVFAFTRAGDREAQALRPRRSARSGPATRTRRRPSRSTPRSSSPRSARSCPPRSARSTAAGRSSAPAST